MLFALPFLFNFLQWRNAKLDLLILNLKHFSYPEAI